MYDIKTNIILLIYKILLSYPAYISKEFFLGGGGVLLYYRPKLKTAIKMIPYLFP